MIRLLLLLCSLAWPVTRTHQELIDYQGRKGDITHLFDLYSRTEGASPRERGADPTGTRDATAAIQSIIDDSLPIFDDGTGIYKIHTPLRVPAGYPLRIRGTLRLRPDSAITALTHYGTTVRVCTLTNATRTGYRARTILVTEATGMQAGDLISLKSLTLWPYNNEGSRKKGELHKIESIYFGVAPAPDTITPTIPMFNDYTPGSDTIVVTAYRPQVIDIEGLEIVFDPPQSGYGLGFQFLDGATSRIRNVTVKGAQAAGISLGDCFGLTVENPRLIENYASGAGYGVAFSQVTQCHVKGGFGYRNRHAVDFSGDFPSHFSGVQGMHVVGHPDEGDCMGTHGPANHITFRGNTCAHAPVGIGIRSPNTQIHDNFFTGIASAMVNLNGAPGISVRGNTHFLQAGGNNPDGAAGYFMEVSLSDNAGRTDTSDFYSFANTQFVVEDNTVSPRIEFLRFNSGIRRMEFWSVRNNAVTLQTSSSGDTVSFIRGVDSVLVKNTSVIAGNKVRSAGANTYVELKNVYLRGGADAGQVLRGLGTPEAIVTAPVGSLYIRTDGGASTTLYVKESGTGNTGWVAK